MAWEKHMDSSEAAQSCKVILDIIEASLPEGLPEKFAAGHELQDTLIKAVELLPKLCKLSGAPQEAILAYRRALLYHWNLDIETKTKIEKEYAVFLLYSGCEASPPDLCSQIKEGFFVPRNNLEEAVLLLLILLKKFALGRIGWDQSILDHLTFALSISGDLMTIAHQVEELSPGIMEISERYHTLAYCYYGDSQDVVALNILRNSLDNRENPNDILELLLASKICAENKDYTEEGLHYAHKLISKSNGICNQMTSVAHCLLGQLLSTQSRSASSVDERVLRQSEAIETLETAERTMRERDTNVIYHCCLENAEQRKLDVALYFANQLLELEAGTSFRGWILLARILSAQKHFVDAALKQTGKLDQGELLRTKAKLQIERGHYNEAMETYTQVFAILHVRSTNTGDINKDSESWKNIDRNLEMETWHDLANLYTSLSQWQDAEVCLSKSSGISPYSAARWHTTGLLYEAKGQDKEALKSYWKALDIDPNHVSSLVSSAILLRQKGDHQSLPIARSFLNDALRIDRTNASAWYHLGLLYEGASALEEAAECFEAAAFLQETAPVEPFR